jgi:nucleotide-binding universal stress UspA family protein
MGKKKKCMYIKVVEAQGVLDGLKNDSKPFAVVKLNGDELFQKRTKAHHGVDWWEQTFLFKIRDVETDWFSVEIREQSGLSSTWLGETQLRVRDFKDGKMHDDWYQLGKGAWKRHRREARGHVHLHIQLMDNKYDRPFEQAGQKKLSFQDWSRNRHSSAEVTEEMSQVNRHFEVTYPTMVEARHLIVRNARRILSESVSGSDLAEMKRLNRVNCLHRGNFENTKGKRYLVCVDGSDSANTAFENTLKLMDHQNDHLFIVSVRERLPPDDIWNPTTDIILTHKLWRAAAGIITLYQNKLKHTKIEYTSIMPEADDARGIICAIVKRYKVDVVVVGRHKRGEMKHHSNYFRSFSKYCQRNSGCTVFIY